jgi:hypothetical protein
MVWVVLYSTIIQGILVWCLFLVQVYPRIHPLSILYPSFIHPLSILYPSFHPSFTSNQTDRLCGSLVAVRCIPGPQFQPKNVFGFRWRHRPGNDPHLNETLPKLSNVHSFPVKMIFNAHLAVDFTAQWWGFNALISRLVTLIVVSSV